MHGLWGLYQTLPMQVIQSPTLARKCHVKKIIFMMHKVGPKQSEAMFVVEEGWTQTCLKWAFIWKKPVEAE